MRPRRAIWLRAWIVAVAAALAALALSAPGAGEATAFRHTYLQINLCGNACNNGGSGVVINLENAIRERTPFAVTLNEVCENQYERLRADLDPYQGRFDPTGPTCHNGARYGNAVLVRTTTITLVGSWPLPNPAGDETRRLMCLSTQVPGPVMLAVCVTHASNLSGNTAAQVRAVADIVTGLAGSHAVLLGGDFNTDPADPRMDPLYSGCYGSETGAFHEADPAGCASRSMTGSRVAADVANQDTYPQHKFDYIFLSAGDWSATGADVADAANGLSDHEGLWATTTLLPGGRRSLVVADGDRPWGSR